MTGEPSDAYDAVGLNHVAGVWLSSAAPAITRYGYIQVGGIADVAYADTTSVGLSPTSTGLPVYAVADGTSAAFGGVAGDWSHATVSSQGLGFPAKPFAKSIETVATSTVAGAATGDAILLIDRVGW